MDPKIVILVLGAIVVATALYHRLSSESTPPPQDDRVDSGDAVSAARVMASTGEKVSAKVTIPSAPRGKSLLTTDPNGNISLVDYDTLLRTLGDLNKKIDNEKKRVDDEFRKVQYKSQDVKIGDKWLTGNRDGCLRITKGNGNSLDYGEHGLATHHLWSNGNVNVLGTFEANGKKYSSADLRKALDMALNSVQVKKEDVLRDGDVVKMSTRHHGDKYLYANKRGDLKDARVHETKKPDEFTGTQWTIRKRIFK